MVHRRTVIPLSDENTAQQTSASDADQYNVVIYCRVSTDDKEQTNDTQERLCREFCQSRGYNILKVYRDEVSGTSEERDEFDHMWTRITRKKDVDYVVAYDQSRITRGEDFEEIKKDLAQYRCRFKFVKLDMDETTLAGKITQSVMMHVNSEENKVRNEKTKLGMDTRRREGKHIGRPARFLIAEDIEVKSKTSDGVFKAGVTIVVSEKTLFDYARSGLSINYVATRLLGISPTTLMWELKPRDASDPKNRCKGLKDRYSTYINLYHEALRSKEGDWKGSSLERVENPAETALERVVE